MAFWSDMKSFTLVSVTAKVNERASWFVVHHELYTVCIYTLNILGVHPTRGQAAHLFVLAPGYKALMLMRLNRAIKQPRESIPRASSLISIRPPLARLAKPTTHFLSRKAPRFCLPNAPHRNPFRDSRLFAPRLIHELLELVVLQHLRNAGALRGVRSSLKGGLSGQNARGVSNNGAGLFFLIISR